MTTRPSALKKLSPPPPPLHEKLSIEGRWNTVKLLQSFHPNQDPLELEKQLFVQAQGDVHLYESSVYRLCAALYFKRDQVAASSPESLVSEGVNWMTEVPTKVPENKAAAPIMLTPKSVECQIKCGRCKSTQVSVEQKQTRGADESMTVFMQCEKCGLRWKM